MADFYELNDELKQTKDPKRKLEIALEMASEEPEAFRPLITYLDPTSVDAPSSITLKIGTSGSNPDVAYPIFPSDLIRGFKNPEILIEFDPVSLLMLVEFKYAEKLSEDAPCPLNLMKKVLPSDTIYQNREQWEQLRCKEAEKVKNLFANQQKISDNFAVSKLSYKTHSEFLNRVFIFSLFFIEGATLPAEGSEWEVYVVHRPEGEFAAYMSCYTFGYFSSSQVFEKEGGSHLLRRERISQVIVLPQFRRQQIASNLYTYVIKLLVETPYIKEISVEDPSLEFDMLRDRCNYEWLRSNSAAKPLLDEYADDQEQVIEKLRNLTKLSTTQLERVAEIYFYAESGNKESKDLSRLIKQRLWNTNYEALSDMDNHSQRENLQKLYTNAVHAIRVTLKLEAPEEEEEEEEEDEEDAEGEEHSILQGLLEPKRRKI